MSLKSIFCKEVTCKVVIRALIVSVVMFASIDWIPGFNESGRIRNIDILQRLKYESKGITDSSVLKILINLLAWRGSSQIRASRVGE